VRPLLPVLQLPRGPQGLQLLRQLPPSCHLACAVRRRLAPLQALAGLRWQPLAALSSPTFTQLRLPRLLLPAATCLHLPRPCLAGCGHVLSWHVGTLIAGVCDHGFVAPGPPPDPKVGARLVRVGLGARGLVLVGAVLPKLLLLLLLLLL
jgi:hypothetical protein